MRRRPRQRDGGLTLLEALLAVVVLALAVTAVTAPFTAGAQNERADARRTLAVLLAEELLEEILSRPFADPQGGGAAGPESGETSRALFDNMDDYDGYAEDAGAVLGPDGGAIDDPAAAGLSRHASATYVYVSGQDTGQDPTFLRVVVEVRYRGAAVASLTRLAYATAE